MSNPFGTFQSAPALRPMPNIGCLMDIHKGSYYQGIHGESILNGGMSYFDAAGGRGNSFKTALLVFTVLRVLGRYPSARGLIYDTETSMQAKRINHLAQFVQGLAGQDIFELGRILLTDSTIYSGNRFFELYKETLEERPKEKGNRAKTPFLGRDGELIEAYHPFITLMDSLSQFRTDSVNAIADKAEIGESARNMEAMRDAHAKDMMLREIPDITAKFGAQILMSAHIGDQMALDPYSPPQKRLAFLKQNVKFKNVPEKFTFLTNFCLYSMGLTTLTNQSTKAPEYPSDSDDNLKGDTDLQLIHTMILRNKYGPSGATIDFIVSQSEGIKASLTEFHYLKTMERYGLGGNDRNYYLELVPDISLSRTTVRGKLDREVRLQRATEILSEMCQMFTHWSYLPSEIYCTPKELYDGIKAQGYDWDDLLTNTQGYWAYADDPTAKPFLSTMDLLRMRAGLYTPYWK